MTAATFDYLISCRHEYLIRRSLEQHARPARPKSAAELNQNSSRYRLPSYRFRSTHLDEAKSYRLVKYSSRGNPRL